MSNDRGLELNFYITQYRKMFLRLAVLYFLILLCIGYVFWQLNTLKDPVYYAASESGMLIKLTPYTERRVNEIRQGLKG